ncbi:MAG: hypothetical protein ISS11_06420, partial [Candidatus Marinimicrobia bacterium]|nr:hypothetical protein [Candidatus Neomarinimicrobiota bacterium]
MKYTTIVFSVILLSGNILLANCDADFVEIDDICYWESDIFVLQDIINTNSLDIENPVELGDQIWSEGRLVYLELNFALLSYIPNNFGNLNELTE